VGGKTEFINNNNRCPKCNSVTYIPGAARPYSSKPFKPGKRLIMFFLAAVISSALTMIRFKIGLGQLAIWFFVEAGIIGLIIYEILYRTQKWLSLKTLILYILIAIPVSSWAYALFYGIQFSEYAYVFSLAPLIRLFSAMSYPDILYSYFETAVITSVAYWLIRVYKA
jgi:hypothetical protein